MSEEEIERPEHVPPYECVSKHGERDAEEDQASNERHKKENVE